MNDKNLKEDFTPPAATGAHDIKVLERPNSAETSLKIVDLTLEVPGGQDVLIHKGNLHLQSGDRIALTGANGSGKSSLFRVSMGLWNSGNGSVKIKGQNQKDIFCASQQSRMPDTMLDGMLAYPHPADTFTPEQYESALREADYEDIIPQLPWNAVKADNIMRFCEKVISKTLAEATATITAQQANAFIKGMSTALEKHLAVPRMATAYFTGSEKTLLAKNLTSAATAQFEKRSADNTSSLMLPRRAGKKAGEKLAMNILRELDNNLVRGGRLKLSGGQVQKLVFGRIFLQKPKIMFLDEVTSALHPETAHNLYEKLVQKLPDSMIIGIIHDDSLIKFFTKHADLRDKQLTVKPVEKDAKPVSLCGQCPYKP
ncbi:MAG: ATP-binding cassette domain-containing protein [Rhodospirillales bacterium]|nr:ATP-binding cassette domain-containing protein [Rhodospirillales bacterium]MCB9995344.1 ATP-binding cassette domain-containing protein [Rhodospirillales bacterium]